MKHAPELRQLAIDRSLEILKFTEATEPEFVEAILVLRKHLDDSNDPRERARLHQRLVEDEECLSALQRGLQSLWARPEGIYLITQISNKSNVASIAWPFSSTIPLAPSDPRSRIRPRFDEPLSHASPVLEILNLLIALSEGKQFSSSSKFVELCEELVERTEEGFVKVGTFKDEVQAIDRRRVVLFYWPSLQTSYEPFLAPDQVSSPSPQQWMDYFINVHASYLLSAIAPEDDQASEGDTFEPKTGSSDRSVRQFQAAGFRRDGSSVQWAFGKESPTNAGPSGTGSTIGARSTEISLVKLHLCSA